MNTRRSSGLLLLLLAGCSTFESDWEAAVAAPRPEDAFHGAWEGTWLSRVNAHTGALRCILSPREDGTLEARYHATYEWCLMGFTFEYAVPMSVERRGDAWHFKGSAELGCWIAGGRYEYEGRATPTEYEAVYRTEQDRGVFSMRRPAAIPRP